jgi:hypothetical protein
VGHQSSIPGGRHEPVSSPQLSDRLRGTPGLPCTLYRGGAMFRALMWPERDAEHSFSCIAEVRKAWSCTSARTPRIILGGSVNLFISS